MKVVLFCFPPLGVSGDLFYFRTQQFIDSLKKDFKIKIIKPISKTGWEKDRRFSFRKIFIFLKNTPLYFKKIKGSEVVIIFPSVLWYFWIPVVKMLNKKIVIDHFTTSIFPLETKKIPFFLKKIISKVDKFLYKKADIIITHTNTMKKEIVNFYKISKNKVIVVYSLVDTKLFDPKKVSFQEIKKLKKYCHLPENKKILLYHGRHHPFHGLPKIKKIALLNFKKNKKNIFVFVWKKLKNKKNMYFLEHVSFKNLYKTLALADLWLGRFNNSIRARRALSSCMLQAMAMRIPVITFATQENSHIIKDKENGFLTRSLNPENISNQIDKIFEDEKLLKKVGDNARETIKTNFSLKNWQKVHLAIQKL